MIIQKGLRVFNNNTKLPTHCSLAQLVIIWLSFAHAGPPVLALGSTQCAYPPGSTRGYQCGFHPRYKKNEPTGVSPSTRFFIQSISRCAARDPALISIPK